MTQRRLIINGKWPRSTPLKTSEFLWRARPAETSFHTKLGPQLAAVGSVPDPNVDLVALAVLTFLADRTVKRPKGWGRELELELPVHDVGKWEGFGPDLTEILQILTGDRWAIEFRKRASRKQRKVADRPEIDRVLLFSGGADSLCGAIRSLSAGERLLLVSHWDWAGHSKFQASLARHLHRLFPDQVWLAQHRLGRRTKQLGGARFGGEPTRRSRSLLFIALGLAHASVDPSVPLMIAENGFAALNPPLAGERRGALSTRTTHPAVLDGISDTVERVGGHGSLSNPFETMTKGEMFTEAVGHLGQEEATRLLSMSHSCAHVRWAIGTGLRPDTQCGICFGCLVRRSAFLAAGLDDETTYLHTELPASAQPKHLAQAARSEISTVRYAAQRGISHADVLSLGLPDRVSVEDAADLANRGLTELSTAVDDLPDLVGVA